MSIYNININMTSPIRVYTFVNKIFKTKTHKIMNLTKISSVELNSKTLKINMSHEKESIGGGFIFFSGGRSIIERINFDTEEEAQKEFNDILQQFENYYKK